MGRTQGRVRRAVGLLLCGSLVWSGCYTYTPIQLDAVPADQPVRVHVSAAVAARLLEDFGQVTQSMDGLLTPWTGDTVLLSVPVAWGGAAFEDRRQNIRLVPDQVLRVERRDFSRSRTTLMVAGVVALVLFSVYSVKLLIDPNLGENGDPPDPPPEQEFRLDLRRVLGR